MVCAYGVAFLVQGYLYLVLYKLPPYIFMYKVI